MYEIVENKTSDEMDVNIHDFICIIILMYYIVRNMVKVMITRLINKWFCLVYMVYDRIVNETHTIDNIDQFDFCILRGF